MVFYKIYLVINLNLEIENAKQEFDKKNYEGALEILEGAEVDEDYRKLAIILKIASLMGLKRYDECISVIDSYIEEFPHDDFLWSRKVECHYFMGDEENAVKSLSELERITNKDDKYSLVFLAEEFILLNNYEMAIKYCDIALDIDGDFVDAHRQKAMAASAIKDHEMMNDCADRLLELYENEFSRAMIPLMLKLFSGRYRDCLDIINDVDDLDGVHSDMLKGIVYNAIVDDLNVEIRTSAPVELTIDEVLNLLFGYHYDGIGHGEIKGVLYLISKCQ